MIDFGLCAEMKDGVTSRAFVGTVLYTAPEILKVDGHNVACDLWSLGVMAFALVSGQFPWYSDSKDVCGQMIKYTPLQFPREVSGGPSDPLNSSEKRVVHDWDVVQAVSSGLPFARIWRKRRNCRGRTLTGTWSPRRAKLSERYRIQTC